MNNDTQPELSDALAAGVFRAGLKSGVLNVAPMIQWADRQIGEQAEPASWLIDLSIAQPDQVNDIVALLRPAAEGVSNDAIAAAGLALLEMPGDQSAAAARRLLSMMHAYAQHSEAKALFSELNELSASFAEDENGNAGSVIAFAKRFQSDATVAFFDPVRWER
jgi:hypothetical protein